MNQRIQIIEEELKGFNFQGYSRADGSKGVRNHLVVMPASVCANSLVNKIVELSEEKLIPLNHKKGCCQLTPDARRTTNILTRLGQHPNVAGVLLVALGCEGTPYLEVKKKIEGIGKPVELLVIQEDGGSRKALEKGLKLIARLKKRVNESVSRGKAGLADLIVGLECGGSDATSGITANPVLGWVADRLIAVGSTVILSETTELIGAEHVLAEKTINNQVRERLIEKVKKIETSCHQAGENIRGSQPTPGNIEGGLSSIEEKSLGNIYKAGSTPIREVLDYGEQPTGKGLVFMDTPGQDIESMTGMAAGGAQIFLFSTGRGSPVGFPTVPVIKVVGNSQTFQTMPGDFDINAGTIIEGTESIAEVGERTLNLLLKVCQGQLTSPEENEYYEMGILKDVITL